MDTEREKGRKWTHVGCDGMTDVYKGTNAYVGKAPDRKYVDLLLDISEESFAKDFTHQFQVQSGWEEAVQAWSRCPPMACLFQLQKKCKKDKMGDNDYHCLLCTDVKLSNNPEPDRDSESSETNCSSAEEQEDKAIRILIKTQKRPQSSPSAICYSNTEQHGFNIKEHGTNQAQFDNKVTKEDKWNMFQETLPRLAYINLAIQCPVMKEKEIIHNSAALPSSSSNPWSTSSRRNAGSNLSIAGSLVVETGSYGMPETGEGCDDGEEITSDSHTDTDVPEDNCGSLPYKYFKFHSSKKLPSAFRSGISKRYENPSELSLPRAVHLTGRRFKLESLRKAPMKNNQAQSLKRIKPQLPVLLGTRVPILTASHRILYTPNF